MNAAGFQASDRNPSGLRGLRATRALVDLDAVAGNVRAVREVLPSATRLMAVVKADGYGHGAVQVAQTALEAGAALLGIATVGEGQALRAAGIAAPIVLLGSIDPEEAAAACRLRLDVTVADGVLLESVREAARARPMPEPIGVHLKIDTGLRRYGATPESALAIAANIADDPHLHFAGICTHFASADEPEEPFSDLQLRKFKSVLVQIQRTGQGTPPRHVANSAGILTGRGADYEIVRLGISLYGVPPSEEVALLPGMHPVMRVVSKIARIVEIAPGESVGYNRTFRAEAPTTGALVPIGYADGYRRAFSGCSWMGLHGKRARVLGRVSMDQLVVEVPSGIEARVGDTVHVLSVDPACGGPSVSDLARLAGTNPYEILVGIRSRVPRVFLRGGEVFAVRGAGEAVAVEEPI